MKSFQFVDQILTFCTQLMQKSIAYTTTLTLPHVEQAICICTLFSSFVLQAVASFFVLAKNLFVFIMQRVTLRVLTVRPDQPLHIGLLFFMVGPQAVAQHDFAESIACTTVSHGEVAAIVYSLEKLFCGRNSCFCTTSQGVTRLLCLLRSHVPWLEYIFKPFSTTSACTVVHRLFTG